MATTFDVYPRSAQIPSFQDILDLSTRRLNERLKELKIDVAPAIQTNLYSTEPDMIKSIDMTRPARWEESEYAWFFIDPIPGGADAHHRLVTELHRQMWERNSDEHPLLQERAVLIRACLHNGYYWYFRRSAGQPAIINLAYGLIAASVAELTNGFIFSDDHAWDYKRFPATPEEFYTWYFRPEMAIEPGMKDWAERNISLLAEELTA
jgi:hypothetical protein